MPEALALPAPTLPSSDVALGGAFSFDVPPLSTGSGDGGDGGLLLTPAPPLALPVGSAGPEALAASAPPRLGLSATASQVGRRLLRHVDYCHTICSSRLAVLSVQCLSTGRLAQH